MPSRKLENDINFKMVLFEEDGEKYWFDPLTRKYNYDGNIEAISVTLENIRGHRGAHRVETGFDDPSMWDEIDADPGDFTPERFVYSAIKAQKLVRSNIKLTEGVDYLGLSQRVIPLIDIR